MKTLKIYAIAGISFLFILLNSSCEHEPELIPGTAQVCFNSDVMLIISTKCSVDGCHQGGGEGPQLTNYAGIYELVTPFKPMKSKLYKVMNKHANAINKMPPKPYEPLNNSQLDIISLWILQGAINDTSCVSSQ
jgi:hypothetical protein